MTAKDKKELKELVERVHEIADSATGDSSLLAVSYDGKTNDVRVAIGGIDCEDFLAGVLSVCIGHAVEDNGSTALRRVGRAIIESFLSVLLNDDFEGHDILREDVEGALSSVYGDDEEEEDFGDVSFCANCEDLAKCRESDAYKFRALNGIKQPENEKEGE